MGSDCCVPILKMVLVIATFKWKGLGPERYISNLGRAGVQGGPSDVSSIWESLN